MATAAITTGAQFDALPYDQGRLWELVDGELIKVSSPTPEHQFIQQRLIFALMLYFQAHPEIGTVLNDVEFALDRDCRVRPDVLVLLAGRLPALDVNRVPVPGAPDIAVEIISPSEGASDIRQKLDAYLNHGTQEVWQVYPRSKSVVVHRGATSTTLKAPESVVTLLLPGFSLPVQSLF
jgi:Uma2 family endonuclease